MNLEYSLRYAASLEEKRLDEGLGRAIGNIVSNAVGNTVGNITNPIKDKLNKNDAQGMCKQGVDAIAMTLCKQFFLSNNATDKNTLKNVSLTLKNFGIPDSIVNAAMKDVAKNATQGEANEQ